MIRMPSGKAPKSKRKWLWVLFFALPFLVIGGLYWAEKWKVEGQRSHCILNLRNAQVAIHSYG